MVSRIEKKGRKVSDEQKSYGQIFYEAVDNPCKWCNERPYTKQIYETGAAAVIKEYERRLELSERGKE